MTNKVTSSSIIKRIKEEEIKFIDFRFCDYNGRWLHISHCADALSTHDLDYGVSFDGSSVAGWKTINDSDMTLLPQLDCYFIDPFTTISTLVIICDVIDPETNSGYEKDPRDTAKKAENYLKESGIGDVAFFWS